jgi:hypothetical protein
LSRASLLSGTFPSNWSDVNAESYAREQQQDFGIGQVYENGEYRGKNPAAAPGSVVALATLPDHRGVKPKTQPPPPYNPGLPFAAVGPAVLLGLLAWPFAGLRGRGAFEKTLVLCALVTLVAWFFLTQQSRYIVSLILMLAPLLGGAIAALPFRHLLMAAVAAQSFYSVYLFSQLPITISGQDSLRSSFEFYEETSMLNELGKSEDVYVALYDEVRGYYLDVPYFWANPGHHTMLPKETYAEPGQLIDGLKSLGVTHISLSLTFLSGEERAKIEAGLQSQEFDDFSGVADFREQIVLASREGLIAPLSYFTNENGRLRSVVFKIN